MGCEIEDTSLTVKNSKFIEFNLISVQEDSGKGNLGTFLSSLAKEIG